VSTPDISLAYLDQPLNQISIDYQNDDFYGERFFPPVPVKFQTGRVFRYWFEAFRPEEDLRARLSESKEVQPWTMDAPNYFCQDHSLRDGIGDEDRANSALPDDLETRTVENLTQKVLLNLELLAFNKIFGTGSPVTLVTLSGTSQWSDFVNSNPAVAWENARVQIKQAVAKGPNVLAVSYPVNTQLRQHPLIIDRFKYTAPMGMADPHQLASVAGVPDGNYWVLGAEYDASAEGVSPMGLQNSTSLLNFVWGKNALMAYVPTPGRLQTLFGYEARWLFGAPDLGGTLVKRYREEKKSADFLEIHRYHDIVLTVPGAAYGWINATA
jgi:hypothetical protein